MLVSLSNHLAITTKPYNAPVTPVTPDLVAEAVAAVSGEAVIDVVRLSGNAPVPTWRVTTPTRVVAARLYPETEGTLPNAFASRQVALLGVLRSQGFPVPEVVTLGRYEGRTLLVQSWLGEMALAEALGRSPERTGALGEMFGALHASLHALPTASLTGVAQLQLPPGGRAALLHLDYHPFNVLVGRNEALGVIDWDNARLGDPRADVARTLSILSINPDLQALPREAKRALRALRRAYLRGYREAAGAAALAGLPPFLAWSGRYMLADLERRYDKEALGRVRRWTARWARALDCP